METGFYNGPQLTGEAIDAHVFVMINPTPNPDTVVMCDDGTTAPIAMVSTVALESGQSLYGIQNSGIARIKCAAGQNPVAGARLTSTTDGEATAATTADYVYAVATEPATASGGYVMAQLVAMPEVIA